jgi:Flp pilus assembly protein TadB
MVIAGLVGFIGYFFSMLVSAFTIANSALGVQALMIPTLFLAVGLLIYVYYVNKGYKSGIDMNMVYKELPPE